MEMLLKDAFINNQGDKKTIQFLDPDLSTNEEFNKSFDNVVSMIDGYDIKRSSINKEKEIFYLYSFHTTFKNIEHTLYDYIYKNTDEILNIEETNLFDSLVNKDTNGIYWDLKNDLIVVSGLDNLKTLLLELEKKRWECIKIQDEEFMKEYMELCASKVYKKVMKKS